MFYTRYADQTCRRPASDSLDQAKEQALEESRGTLERSPRQWGDVSLHGTAIPVIIEDEIGQTITSMDASF